MQTPFVIVRYRPLSESSIYFIPCHVIFFKMKPLSLYFTDSWDLIVTLLPSSLLSPCRSSSKEYLCHRFYRQECRQLIAGMGWIVDNRSYREVTVTKSSLFPSSGLETFVHEHCTGKITSAFSFSLFFKRQRPSGLAASCHFSSVAGLNYQTGTRIRWIHRHWQMAQLAQMGESDESGWSRQRTEGTSPIPELPLQNCALLKKKRHPGSFHRRQSNFLIWKFAKSEGWRRRNTTKHFHSSNYRHLFLFLAMAVCFCELNKGEEITSPSTRILGEKRLATFRNVRIYLYICTVHTKP